MSADITVLAANHVQHTAGPLESKVDQLPSGGELRRWRQSCCCGFLPMWERTIGFAIESYARHYNRASR